MQHPKACSHVASWSCCGRAKAQTGVEGVALGRAGTHTQTRTWVFSKQSKNDDRCSIEVQKSIANTKAAAHLKAAVHTAMGQCD